MLQGGYFTNLGGSNGVGGSGGSSNDIYVDSDGNIVYAPFDPIFIDDDNKVFLSQDEKNARIFLEEGKLFVEKVV